MGLVASLESAYFHKYNQAVVRNIGKDLYDFHEVERLYLEGYSVQQAIKELRLTHKRSRKW